jgi:hypothetical protein
MEGDYPNYQIPLVRYIAPLMLCDFNLIQEKTVALHSMIKIKFK